MTVGWQHDIKLPESFLRYNFSHLPLGQKFRNYADISISISEDFVTIQAHLVPISTDIFKVSSWEEGEENEDEEEEGDEDEDEDEE